VDIDRLLPSLDKALVAAESDGSADEWKLVVDDRGIAVVEQLLFARMVLYDTVYHHHKVRAAQAALSTLLAQYYRQTAWPTSSQTLQSMRDFLEMDEYDFYGSSYKSESLQDAVNRLRYRILPERALVITPRALTDDIAHTKWGLRTAEATGREDAQSQANAKKYVDALTKKIATYASAETRSAISQEDVFVDVPEPPGYKKLGESTFIKIHGDCVEPLKKLFPFHKVVNNYSKQYKYRTYVFAPENVTAEVAYAAFRAFYEDGIKLNDLGLILAHQEKGRARDLLMKHNIPIPDWRKKFYVPDEAKQE
jgi:HD superfamily phosphohydrolase